MHADRSVEDTIRTSTGDKIAGVTGVEVKFLAERKLGGRAEALAPHALHADRFLPHQHP